MRSIEGVGEESPTPLPSHEHHSIVSLPTAPPPLPITVGMLSGATAGLVTSVLFQPLDLVKTRLQVTTAAAAAAAAPHTSAPTSASASVFNATTTIGSTISSSNSSGTPKNTATTMNTTSLSTFGVIRSVVGNEGVFALWRGLGASIARMVPGIALYFGTLSQLEAALASRRRIVGEENLAVTAPVPWRDTFAAGLAARTLSGLALLPVTVAKARLESGLYSYKGLGSALTSIARSEGVRGLYSGLGVTLIRDVPFSGLFVVTYRSLQSLTRDRSSLLPSSGGFVIITNAACGLGAGALTSMLTQPMDVVKTRLQTRAVSGGGGGGGDAIEGTLAAIRATYRAEGTRGFMVGLVARGTRRSLVAAVSWALYEHLNPLYTRILA